MFSLVGVPMALRYTDEIARSLRRCWPGDPVPVFIQIGCGYALCGVGSGVR
jgi:hypothetical protein